MFARRPSARRKPAPEMIGKKIAAGIASGHAFKLCSTKGIVEGDRRAPGNRRRRLSSSPEVPGKSCVYESLSRYFRLTVAAEQQTFPERTGMLGIDIRVFLEMGIGMKKVLASAAVLVAGAVSAQAADLPRKAPIKAPVLQVYDWTGFYLGVNAGGSVGRDFTRTTITAGGAVVSNETSHLSPAGAIGGGQIGYNWQFKNFYNLVLGLEADIQASGQRDSFTCVLNCIIPAPAGFQTYNQKLDWFGTARVRAGIANGPVLSYITGGYAYGHVETSSTVAGLAPAPVTITTSGTRGGYVIGSGVEAQLGGNWTGKLEYLYVDLGTQAVGVPAVVIPGAGAVGGAGSTRIRDHIFRGGVNYSFGNNAGYTAPVANWSGFYIGANAGSIIGRDRSTLRNIANPNTVRFSLVPDGYIGGGQIGYNWQAAAWVFGVEGDFQGSSARDTKVCLSFCTGGGGVIADQRLPWLATARGRVGYSVGSTLFYGTAGYAYGETRTRFTSGLPPLAGIAEVKRSKGGYVAGAGIESPLTFLGFFGPQWTVKTEYLYVDLGRTATTFAALPGTNVAFTTETREHIFRTGINYHFNTPVAVVAKY